MSTIAIPEDFDFCVKFEVPPDYAPPETYEDQENCIEYPNINTSQYRQKPAEHFLDLLPFYQCLSRNSEGTTIVASNSYNTRRWNGSIFGFDNVDEERPVLETREVAFKVSADSTISDMKFIDDTTFALTESNGQVTLFSTRSVMRETPENKYCLFRVGQKTEHRGYANCLEIFHKNPQKMITGDSYGWLITWDLGNADLTSTQKIRFAHSDAINDISADPKSEDCFVTASNDKNLYHFDMRDPRPCTALMEAHGYQLKSCKHLNDHQLLVGDQKGFAYVVDTKMPKEVLTQKEINDRAVHKFFVKGENVVALTDSNRLSVQQFNGKEILTVLDATEAPNFLRSATWINENEFYVAGWSNYMQKYKI
ncbi:uncharacterized protein LOC134830620 [Culicoides brevitarsis]|uniref:uncharacterized protein LOC134830620 n=1 Tax=Culicoides brevitarsis TaxID=469753 RepID=UPI00307B15AB